MTDKDRAKIKKNIDEMSAKIFDYINAAEPDPEEREHRYVEIACAFIGASLDYSKSMEDIATDIEDCLGHMDWLLLINADRFKSGILPDDRKLSEFGGNEK
jgi:hypothetical protein